MTPEQLVLIERVWRIAGWTMLHYLWVGALIGLTAALLRVALRCAAPGVRYALSLTALATLASSPVGIALLVALTQQAMTPATAVTEWEPVEQIASVDSTGARDSTEAPAMLPTWPGRRGEVAQEPVVLLRAKTQAAVSSQAAPAPPPLFETWLARGVQLAPWLWVIGAPVMLLWLFTGLAGGSGCGVRAGRWTRPSWWRRSTGCAALEDRPAGRRGGL